MSMFEDERVLLEPPTFETRAVLTIEALAPLSLVAAAPGKYYRSQPAPTRKMLYGLVENALGWHFDDAGRAAILRRLETLTGMKASASGVGYESLLQFHLRWGVGCLPPVTHYDDLWCQHLRTESTPFVGGSREYDRQAIPLMEAVTQKRVKVEERADARKDPEALTDFQDGDRIHPKVLRPAFPQYYVSPTPREYVVPQSAYRFQAETSAALAKRIAAAFENPAAPLYLGSNDGWVEVEWRVFS